GSCAAPSAKGDDKFITTDYLQQCRENWLRSASVLRPLASSAASALSFFSSIICLSPLLE
ncbi:MULTISPECIES: hypothetical protein, partial [Citrobacter freundii complex]